MEEEINFNQLKGKIEKDADWHDGMNAFRSWMTSEISVIREDIHDIKVFMNKYQASVDYIEKWKKCQQNEKDKIEGEIL